MRAESRVRLKARVEMAHVMLPAKMVTSRTHSVKAMALIGDGRRAPLRDAARRQDRAEMRDMIDGVYAVVMLRYAICCSRGIRAGDMSI